MTKENCKKLVLEYEAAGRKDLADDVRRSYKNTYGEELTTETAE